MAIRGFSPPIARRIAKRSGGEVSSSFNEWSRPAGGGGVKYAYPPAGGIPAATYNATTEELTLSRAMCRLGEKDLATGKIKPTSETVEVENQVTSVVGSSGKPMTIAMNHTSGYWEVIVDDCSGAASTGTGTNTSISSSLTTANVDPISVGTSSQLGMGYGYEGV